MLSEEEVYNGTKEFLKKRGYKLLAGQPPRGVDHIPVVEIKSELNKDKGSKDSYKPDLVAFKDHSLIIIECKPKFDESDVKKLYNILNSEPRIQKFYKELLERKLICRIEFEEFKKILCGGVAYSIEPERQLDYLKPEISKYRTLNPLDNIYQILISSWQGEGLLISKK